MHLNRLENDVQNTIGTMVYIASFDISLYVADFCFGHRFRAIIGAADMHLAV